MALTTAQLASDEASWFGDFPTENIELFDLAGESLGTFACLVPRADSPNEWGMGGLHQLPRVTVILRRGNYVVDLPVVGALATFRSASWRVASVRRDFPQSPLMIELESPEGKPV